MFRQASVYDRKVAFDAPGHRVLIMRIWPRGVPRTAIGTWLKDAAPSRELLDSYHHRELRWPEFEQRYRSEILDERPQVLDTLRALEQQHDIVWLLCHERIPPEDHCHRLILLELLASPAT
jgi:uncharacterized protein YeaO (DUF488 family)